MSRRALTAKEFEELDCIAYRCEPWLRDSHDMFLMKLADDSPPTLIVYSETALTLSLRGVLWHDTPQGCPTWTGDDWTGACRCDVEVPRG